MGAYCKYAALNHLLSEVVYQSESSWSLCITGERARACFGDEAGKHVVQRVPASESRGRRHTSVVAVAILPLSKETAAFRLPEQDVEISTQKGHGKGGQNQNKVESAVRVIHKPTGLSVFVNGRDQYRNKVLALEILTEKVRERERWLAQEHLRQLKACQLGDGARSGKRRTYNFINSFVLDHLSGCKTTRVKEVMSGRFDLLKG